MTPENLFCGIPPELPVELVDTLHQARGLRIERIVSCGHRCPPGFWYDQDDAEWVMVIQGGAVIEFENEGKPVELRPGSYLNIPAHAKHRVVSTSLAEQTIWLAIHYREWKT
jgi:cupin 2 domain-containing protein